MSILNKRNFIAFLTGLIFSIGLAISGMTKPQKIIGFLNPTDWDPTLMFVMVGALAVHLIAYPLVRKRATPILDTDWHVPTRNDITPRLIFGSAIFGLGWGIGGYCPGPAVTSLASLDIRAILFVVSMIAGMFLFKKTEPKLKLRE